MTSAHCPPSLNPGGFPAQSTPILDASGNIYGATTNGGTFGGVVYKLTKTEGGYTYSNLVDFGALPASANGGTDPVANVILDASGNLYGTTYYGGTGGTDGIGMGFGTVFKLTKTDSGYTYSNIADLGALPADLNAGHNASTSLVFDANGNLYGSAFTGGTGNEGAVFELIKTDSGYTYRNIADLFALPASAMPGFAPGGGDPLIIDASGSIYGTTVGGGTNSYGTVFKLTPNTSAAPEASPLALTLLGLAVGGVIVRRRHKA